MLIAIDIGNTNIVIGVNTMNNWEYIWRLETKVDYFWKYSFQISALIEQNNIDKSRVDQIIICSVVPNLTKHIKSIFEKVFDRSVLILDNEIYLRLPIEINNPKEIGADLIANTVAAFHLYQSDCIIIDFGTALTFTTLSKKGKILGVSITPGLKTAIKSLAGNAAQLPEVPLEYPDSVLGGNTVKAIQSGILVGYVGLVRHKIESIRNEVGQQFKVIATGGLSQILKPLEDDFDEIAPNLTLEGLKFIINNIEIN